MQICIIDDYKDILFWVLSVGRIYNFIEHILHTIGLFVRWRIYAAHEELTLHSHNTDSVAYRFSTSVFPEYLRRSCQRSAVHEPGLLP